MEAMFFFSKATENLAAAELCQEHGFHDASVNRAYYVMLQAAVAVLLSLGHVFDPNKHIEHAKVHSLFSNELTNRRKLVPAKFKTYLYEALRLRAIADYKEASISPKQSGRQIVKTREFVHALEKELRHD